jgi:carboxymethylenebutenolidase
MEKILERQIQLDSSDKTRMPAYAAYPEGKARAGLLVFQEAFGVNGHIRDVARRLAREGYLALAPELFHRTLPPGGEIPYPVNHDFSAILPHFNAITREGALADYQAAYDWMRDELKTDAVGCVGFCLGGAASFTANSRLPLKAAVSFYGSRIMQSFDLAAEQKGPLLLLWGGKDPGSPPEKLAELAGTLKASGKDFVQAFFSEAGHAFHCDERPSYHPASAAIAWAMTLAFLRVHLAAS